MSRKIRTLKHQVLVIKIEPKLEISFKENRFSLLQRNTVHVTRIAEPMTRFNSTPGVITIQCWRLIARRDKNGEEEGVHLHLYICPEKHIPTAASRTCVSRVRAR